MFTRVAVATACHFKMVSSYQHCSIFQLLLVLCRLVGLSERRIIEPSLTAFIGFPFAKPAYAFVSDLSDLSVPTNSSQAAHLCVRLHIFVTREH